MRWLLMKGIACCINMPALHLCACMTVEHLCCHSFVSLTQLRDFLMHTDSVELLQEGMTATGLLLRS